MSPSLFQAVTRICVVVAAGTLVLHVLHGLDVWGTPSGSGGQAIYVIGIFVAGIACLSRGAGAREERGAWLTIGVGLILWGLGELYYNAVLGDEATPSYPSPADVLYFAYYLALYVGILLLCRSRIENFKSSMWLDGAIGAAAMAATATAFLYPTILQASHGDAAQVATQLAYPIADLLLVVVLVGTLGLTGWRMSRDWSLLILGMVAIGIADVVYLNSSARGTYVDGSLMDSAWLAGTTLVTMAAVAGRRGAKPSRVHERAVLVGPTIFALIAVALLAYDHFERIPTASMSLAAAAITLVIMRLVIGHLETARSARQIEELSGLLPICAGCKNVRDDGGYWNQIETYVAEHTSAEFTHSICPDCMARLYPDLVDPAGDDPTVEPAHVHRASEPAHAAR